MVDIPLKDGLLRVRIRAAILLAACAIAIGCTQDAWRTAARRFRPIEALSQSAPESFGKPAHVAIGTRRPLPPNSDSLRGPTSPDREPAGPATQLARPEQRSTPAYPNILAARREGAVRTSPRRPSSAYEPAGFPKNPFVTDVDRQLSELRTAAKETPRENPFGEIKENPFADRPVTVAKNARRPETPRIERRTANPFETPDLPAQAPVPQVEMAASPPPGPEVRKSPMPEGAIRPVALKVTTMVAPERAGQSDPTMIVDSDMLPPRLESRSSLTPVGSGSAAVRELEGPGEPPSQSADRRTSEWLARPEAADQPAAVEPAPPPPVVSELPRADIRVAQRERSWSGSRTMKNVRWVETGEQAARDGLPRPFMPIVLAAVLLALAAWSRFRRRSVA